MTVTHVIPERTKTHTKPVNKGGRPRGRRPATSKTVAQRLGKQKKLVSQGFTKGLSICGITKYARVSEQKVREILTSKSPDIEKAFKVKSELATFCSTIADRRFIETADQLAGLGAAKASALYAQQAKALQENSAQFGTSINVNILINANNRILSIEKLLQQNGVDPTTIVDPSAHGVKLDPLPVFPKQ